MTNRCRVLRPFVLAAILAAATMFNLATPSMAAPTDPDPACVSNCKALLPVVGAVLCPVLCGSNDCDNDCKAAGIPILTCNQICIAL